MPFAQLDWVLPDRPIRQWVLAPPFELAGLLAVRGKVLTHLIRHFVDAVTSQMVANTGLSKEMKPSSGAIVFVQRFTKQMSLYPHLHILFLDGVYAEKDGRLEFFETPPPSQLDLMQVGKKFFDRFEAFLNREGYLNSEVKNEELNDLEKWALQASHEPSLLKRAAFQAKQPDRKIDYGGFSIHAGVTITVRPA